MKGFFLLLILPGCAYLERGEQKQPEKVVNLTPLRQKDYLDCVRNSETYKKNRNYQKQWRVITEFSIAPDGKVLDPRITNSDFEDSALHHCVISQISGLTLPAEQETIVVRQMLNLDPGSEK